MLSERVDSILALFVCVCLWVSLHMPLASVASVHSHTRLALEKPKAALQYSD